MAMKKVPLTNLFTRAGTNKSTGMMPKNTTKAHSSTLSKVL